MKIMLCILLLVASLPFTCSRKIGTAVPRNFMWVGPQVGVSTSAPDGDSRGIKIATANRMIRSYLQGINSQVNTNETRSWTFNADTLRRYLSEGKGKQIVRLKLMLAHSLDYIDSGHEGERPAANSHALTLIVVGLDQNNEYIYNPEGEPYEHAFPCPPRCLGTDTLTTNGTLAQTTP
jgi:hypothetical protein